MKLACAVLVLAVAANIGGEGWQNGRSDETAVQTDLSGRVLGTRVHQFWAYQEEEPQVQAAAQRTTAHSLRIHGLAADGISTITQPVATATAEPATPEPTRDAPVYGAGIEQWRSLVASVFPSWAVSTAMRIIECESKGDPNATGLAGERGLMQIHPIHHDSTYDPAGNIWAAYRISNGGTDWSAWSCA